MMKGNGNIYSIAEVSVVEEVIGATLYMLALMNPISKVFILSLLASRFTARQLRTTSVRSSVIALVMLLSLAAAGHLILQFVFHVEVYSLRVAGGIILFAIGYNALSQGVFFESADVEKVADVSIVPLASPMIAGPATITAAISFPGQYGLLKACIAVTVAVALNLVVMLFARPIGAALSNHNLMGALIRITGLIVATIAVQMVLSGVSEWYQVLTNAAG